jgi:hypothetical protein
VWGSGGAEVAVNGREVRGEATPGSSVVGGDRRRPEQQQATVELSVTTRVSRVVGEQLGPWKSNRREGFEEHEEAEQIRPAAAPEWAGGNQERVATLQRHGRHERERGRVRAYGRSERERRVGSGSCPSSTRPTRSDQVWVKPIGPAHLTI